jgi:hypothetical protein
MVEHVTGASVMTSPPQVFCYCVFAVGATDEHGPNNTELLDTFDSLELAKASGLIGHIWKYVVGRRGALQSGPVYIGPTAGLRGQEP